MDFFHTLQPRILLVDDNSDNLNLMRLFLSDNYRIDEASNGREAVDRFTARAYDLIFMDLEMPVLDGYAATQAIRALERQEQRPPTPILVLTAHALDECRDRCHEAGCTDFLVKPVRKAAILATLDRFLNQKTETTSLRQSPCAVPHEEQGPLVDKDLLRPLLPTFFTTAGETLNAAGQALSRGDLEDARHQGHKLKGSALSYGFTDLGHAALTLERAGENGDSTAASMALQRAVCLLAAARQAEDARSGHMNVGKNSAPRNAAG